MAEEDFDWRTFLGDITHDPQEKLRLADIMSVSPITLTRWVSTGSRSHSRSDEERGKAPRPQLHSLRKLVAALPEYRTRLIPSIIEEYQELSEEDFQQRALQNVSEEPMALSTFCYEQVLEAVATLSGELRFTTISYHIMNYSLQQLDPERLGFTVTLLRCVYPQPGYKVRSLQEILRIGTPPWSMESEERAIFRGAESLAGRSVATLRPYLINNLRAYVGLLPTPEEDEQELSIATCPILRHGLVGGCLRFSSTQPDYFTKERMHLIQKYSHLALEAFERVEYHMPSEIELRLMPDQNAQKPFLLGFSRRLEGVLAQGKIINWEQAMYMTQHLVESDLINLSRIKEGSVL